MNITDHLLSKWIKTDHTLHQITQPESHSLPYTIVRNFLKPNIANELYNFISAHAEFEPKLLLFSTNNPVSDKQWQNAPDNDKLGSFSILTKPHMKQHNGAIYYTQLMHAVTQASFIQLFSTISKTSINKLQAAHCKKLVKGNFLNPHQDKEFGRKLTFIIYLTPNWQYDFGGQLFIEDLNKKKYHVPYEFNSLVLFDVKNHHQHWVTSVHPRTPDHLSRLSIGGWYK
jgi:Rps23 Pro-64 3,4-dihydroxylase Tpa1-like proline 4-hydroxylase